MTHPMHWLASLDDRLPKYRAIYKVIASAIASGQLRVGDKLPPRRVLAKKLSVTVDTVTRAFAELTRHHLVDSRVGDGTYVRERNEFAEVRPLVDLSQNHPGILYEDSLLAATLRDLARKPEDLVDLLNYQDDTGYVPHQRTLTKWLNARGVAVGPGQLAVTSGAQQALYLTLRALLKPGDSLLAEQYTYPILNTMAGQMRLQLLPLAIDEEGLIPSELEQVLKRHAEARVLYCQPSVHNPTTAILGEGRRREIAALARRHDLLVIENITQAMYMERQPVTLFELVPERAILIGSFSKLTSPGLRVGFVAAESRWGSRVAAWLRLSCWMPCLLSSAVVARWIESGEMAELLQAKNRDLEQRQRLARKHLKDFRYQTTPFSNHLWLNLPQPWDAQTLAAALYSERLVIKGAEAFTIGRTPVPRALRLSLGTPPTLKDLDRALKTMAAVFRTPPGGGEIRPQAAPDRLYPGLPGTEASGL